MRFTRIILASLAPIIGFSALMNPPAAGEQAREDVIVRLWHTVVQMVAAPEVEAHSTTSLPDHVSMALPVSLLAETPLLRAALLIAFSVPVLLLTRRPQHLLLRC